MLAYLGMGDRWYHEKPVRVYERPLWEFQAVISGRIGLVTREGPDILRQQRLWLCPPGDAHGWTGEEGRKAEIAVFHFLSVPESLRLQMQGAPRVEIPLSVRDCRRLGDLAEKVSQYWLQPAPGMMICYEHALMELSLLVSEAITQRHGAAGSNVAELRVTSALHWYAERMAENPRLEHVAEAVGSSASHLRRLFHEVLQASPKRIFDQMRFQRAMQLMTAPGVKLSTISADCGFESPSAFSRAFKTKFGCSPEAWRE